MKGHILLYEIQKKKNLFSEVVRVELTVILNNRRKWNRTGQDQCRLIDSLINFHNVPTLKGLLWSIFPTNECHRCIGNKKQSKMCETSLKYIDKYIYIYSFYQWDIPGESILYLWHGLLWLHTFWVRSLFKVFSADVCGIKQGFFSESQTDCNSDTEVIYLLRSIRMKSVHILSLKSFRANIDIVSMITNSIFWDICAKKIK